MDEFGAVLANQPPPLTLLSKSRILRKFDRNSMDFIFANVSHSSKRCRRDLIRDMRLHQVPKMASTRVYQAAYRDQIELPPPGVRFANGCGSDRSSCRSSAWRTKTRLLGMFLTTLMRRCAVE